jgi:Ca2+-transporting ATPase
VKVIARTSPEHKIKIIEALKIRKEIIAMFGDGINDSPALKKADIGVAMGQRGTEVTKEVADIILIDDNFSSMVKGIKEGRTVMDNIKKFVNYLLSCNIAEVLIIFIAVLFRRLVLLPSQILWINLLTDGFPAVALAADPSNPDVMKKKAKKQEILDKQLLWLVFGIGIKKAILLLTMYLFSLMLFGYTIAMTMLFTGIVFYELNRIFVIRMTEKLKFFSNKWLNLSIFVSMMLQLILIYTPLGKMFHVKPLSLIHWYVILSTLVIGFITSYAVTKVVLRYIKD